MTDAYRFIGASLAALGTPEFPLRLLDLAQTTGARQIMVFEHGADHARCLLSRNYARHGLGESLSQRYLDGWFLKDPLRPALRKLRPGQRRCVTVNSARTRMPAAYRQLFFDAVGLAGKTTVLAAGESMGLMVNLYHPQDQDTLIDPDLADLIAQLVIRHFDNAPDTAYAPALSALSARERAVCLGILQGQKTESIAGEMGLSPATVVTYRKRAYQKLGVSSRAGLFALCRAR
jgi:DNA-binding CsgD family transcriptional regulator